MSPSSLTLFQSCPKKFAWRYYYGIEGKREPSDKLKFGTAIHAAIEQNINKPVADWSVRAATQGLEPDLGALVAGTAAAYSVHWDGTLTYRAAELKLETELRDSRLTYVTILDGVAEGQAGQLVVVEHKTTESDIRPGSWWWEKLQLNTQASAYLWAARRNGYDVDHVVWDSIKRPNLRRRTEAVEPEYYTRSGKWGAAGDLKPGTGIPAETVPEFAKRVRDVLTSEPDVYFQRAPVVRMADELEAAMADVAAVGSQILASWDLEAWPRNPNSCFSFGEKCEYWDLCTCSAQPTDDQLFQIRTKREATP